MFASGQIALDPQTGELVGKTVEEQSEQVMRNMGAILESAGIGFDQVVKTTCFLDDMGDFAAFNNVYARSSARSVGCCRGEASQRGSRRG